MLGVFAGEAGCFNHATLSRFEWWPVRSRRPSVSHLVALAQVYGTTPRHLIAPSDWDRFPPADKFTMTALDKAAAEATGPTGDLGMMGTARPQTGRTPLVPPTRWDAPEAIRSGNPIERVVVMTGEESAQYADRGGNIGETTLDLLRESVATEAGRFANVDRLALFGTVRLLRDRLFAYLDGGQPIRQRRDLYFLSAAACGMLANVSNDLGFPTAAMSQARAGHVFAVEAGDPALTAWLYAQQSTFCYWNGQPGKAREYARRGAALNPGGTVGVWLPAVEARASGELGDAEGTRRAVRRAAEIRETVQQGTLDGFGGIMVINPAKQHFYAAGAFLGIGDDETVIAEAAKAVETYLTGPAEDCAYDNVAAARCHAAIAHARAGDLDAAGELAGAPFRSAPSTAAPTWTKQPGGCTPNSARPSCGLPRWPSAPATRSRTSSRPPPPTLNSPDGSPPSADPA